MPGATGLIVFGGELASDPDGLIHAIRQQVEEISSAGGELFDVLKSGEMVLVHWVYPPEKSPVLRPGKAADGKLVIMQGCSDFHEECRNGGVLQELEQSPQNRINYDHNNRSKSKDF